jgi:hypothetical protein
MTVEKHYCPQGFALLAYLDMSGAYWIHIYAFTYMPLGMHVWHPFNNDPCYAFDSDVRMKAFEATEVFLKTRPFEGGSKLSAQRNCCA